MMDRLFDMHSKESRVQVLRWLSAVFPDFDNGGEFSVASASISTAITICISTPVGRAWLVYFQKAVLNRQIPERCHHLDRLSSMPSETSRGLASPKAYDYI